MLVQLVNGFQFLHPGSNVKRTVPQKSKPQAHHSEAGVADPFHDTGGYLLYGVLYAGDGEEGGQVGGI